MQPCKHAFYYSLWGHVMVRNYGYGAMSNRRRDTHV